MLKVLGQGGGRQQWLSYAIRVVVNTEAEMKMGE